MTELSQQPDQPIQISLYMYYGAWTPQTHFVKGKYAIEILSSNSFTFVSYIQKLA